MLFYFVFVFDAQLLDYSCVIVAASDVNVSQVTAKQAVDMVTNLWRRARPLKIDDQVGSSHCIASSSIFSSAFL